MSDRSLETPPDGSDDEAHFCECGQPLVEDADGRHVTVEERTFPFSRSTDFVMCMRCGDQVPVERLHPEPEPATTALHELTIDRDEPGGAAPGI